MKVIVADVYSFLTNNPRNVRFPAKYKNYKILWDLRLTLFELWEGKVTHLALPKLGTPGYDFIEFIDKLHKLGQIKNKPKIEYYEPKIKQKS